MHFSLKSALIPCLVLLGICTWHATPAISQNRCKTVDIGILSQGSERFNTRPWSRADEIDLKKHPDVFATTCLTIAVNGGQIGALTLFNERGNRTKTTLMRRTIYDGNGKFVRTEEVNKPLSGEINVLVTPFVPPFGKGYFQYVIGYKNVRAGERSEERVHLVPVFGHVMREATKAALAQGALNYVAEEIDGLGIFPDGETLANLTGGDFSVVPVLSTIIGSLASGSSGAEALEDGAVGIGADVLGFSPNLMGVLRGSARSVNAHVNKFNDPSLWTPYRK